MNMRDGGGDDGGADDKGESVASTYHAQCDDLPAHFYETGDYRRRQQDNPAGRTGCWMS